MKDQKGRRNLQNFCPFSFKFHQKVLITILELQFPDDLFREFVICRLMSLWSFGHGFMGSDGPELVVVGAMQAKPHFQF